VAASLLLAGSLDERPGALDVLPGELFAPLQVAVAV
jgi:hypothetical protein